jgi:hypothetical protein
VLLVVTGCASSQTTRSTSTAPAYAPSTAVPPAPMPSLGIAEKGTSSAYDSSGGNSTSDADRKIVRTGNISLEVTDIGKTLDEVVKVASDLGGYVVSSNRQGNDENTSGRISIRIPSDRFDEALGRLRTLAVKVLQESTNSRDVTEEYTDLQAQLNNLQATEAQYLALLQKAQKVEEVLSVQRELSNVRGQIDRIKGRIQYLDRTSEMSVIEVSLRQKESIADKGWNPGQTLLSALSGLVVFGKALLNILIWLVIFCPIWGIALAIVLIIRHRRNKAKQTTAK